MLIFASIFGVGFLILVLSLIFGHDTDVDAGMDVGHDVGGDAHGPSVFSIKMIALLMVGFGAVGFGMRATTELSMFQSSLAGVIGALAVGGIGYVILRMFYASQASSIVGDDDIVGIDGNLIDAIERDQNGQIACVVRGREITFLARSHDGQSIRRGAPVRIIGKTGSIVTVKEIQNT